MNDFKVGDIVEVINDIDYNGFLQIGSWGKITKKENWSDVSKGDWEDREEFDNHLHILFEEIYCNGKKEKKERRMNWYVRKDRLKLRKVSNWKAIINE